MTIRLAVAALTDPGQERTVNQDAAYTRVGVTQDGETIGLLVVADGVGGHQAGQVASQMVVETISEYLGDLFGDPLTSSTRPLRAMGTLDEPQRQDSFLEERLQRAVEKANTGLLQYAAAHRSEAGNLGSTVDCVLIKDTLAVGAHVGDSRTYLLADDEISQLTRDHSLVAQLVEAGQLTPTEAYEHPQRNVITRSLGHEHFIEIDTWQRYIRFGDRLLLCTDGLWGMVRDPRQLQDLLQASAPEQAAADLVDAANAAGGKDNIGVVVAHILGR